MTVLRVVIDVFREAFARKTILALFGFILLALVVLALALDLDVVQGALVAGRLFGSSLMGDAGSAEEQLRPVFKAVTGAVFHLGIVFGVVSMSSIAAQLLAPGRVELLLSLPVRRWELVAGTWCGVVAIALLAATFAIGGFSAVLFYKAGFFSFAPIIGAACAAVGFMAVYAVMLFATTVVRSASVASGAGLGLYLLALLTSDRDTFVSWFSGETMRTIVTVLIAPLPRLKTLAAIGMDAAAADAWQFMELAGVVAGTLAFAAGCVAAAAWVVSGRDY